MNFKEYSFLGDTIILSIPEDWLVEKKDNNLIKINFPTGPYPSLDCYLKCFDDPKINTVEKIEEYLSDGITGKKKLLNMGKNTYILEHKFISEKENLLLWKVVNLLIPRSFREIRFSLAWPDNQEANIIVKDISEKINLVIKNIKFNKEKTKFDELGVLSNKLNKSKLTKYSFWNKFDFFLPVRWDVQENKKDKFVNVVIDKKYYLLFEYFEIKKNSNKENNDKVISEFISEITKEVKVEGEILTKSEDGKYLFSFYSIETTDNKEFKNYIWYLFFLGEAKLFMISFIFNFEKQNSLTGNVYYNKIDNLIKNSELN
ncbi:MAG: hypothetical protein CMP36_04630 [Rickettsiales bacterium]|nr:hypothetical protein [Rickettsiales bacterium]OUV76183.1 MAG: hypothetical protein CBC91_06720 [Rickettsiales bacterium TMED131]|tara:strand:- start:1027 stop:1974 length:948 start_codon:yes stop_codon:yes gene_type:complete